jgi:hypothetical protein
MSVVLPQNQAVNTADVPTISRVHVDSDSPADPQLDHFDVHEAYWSPIDKGRTNFISVVGWLLKTVFLPFNNFARYMESPGKVAWDIGFVAVLIAIGIGAFVLAALLVATGMHDVQLATQAAGPQPPFSLATSIKDIANGKAWGHIVDFSNLFTMLAYVLSPLSFVKSLAQGAVVGLFLGLAGSFLGVQALRAAFFLFGHIGELSRRDPIQFTSRVRAIAVLSVLAGVCLWYAWNTGISVGCYSKGQGPCWKMSATGLFLVWAVLAFEVGRGFLAGFIVNFFSDVQIYTTRNQNSAFFGLREAMLKKVTDVILNVLAGAPAGKPYDRVYVMAHSLGSTISLDAIMRLYDLQHASANAVKPALDPVDWQRLRGFITFGTALEKTKYFFDAWSPTPSQEWEQWSGTAYGGIFTGQSNSLSATNSSSAGVFWLNCWYFSDFISDGIVSYRSILLPGETISDYGAALAHARKSIQAGAGEVYAAHLVARNRESFGAFPRHPVTHGIYWQDPWFWHPQRPDDIGVLDVLTATTSNISLTHPHARGILPLAPSPPRPPDRAEPVSKSVARGVRRADIVA